MNGTDKIDDLSRSEVLLFWYKFMIDLLAIVINTFALVAISKCKFRLYGYRVFLLSLTSGDLYIVKYFSLPPFFFFHLHF